ncbi:hypothetical protein PR202_gb05651 [Eleusine coracana subsp. coracana]|uniref:Uncharacterized protein n=1 Tax=Eleusine coracana subsp. coracana TaxID=191504 RepID=A0AAV5E782_ELECO|nr:hypothetical protein PR202_gb05651 [Eleusine coracana subsp. coracana]
MHLAEEWPGSHRITEEGHWIPSGSPTAALTSRCAQHGSAVGNPTATEGVEKTARRPLAGGAEEKVEVESQ